MNTEELLVTLLLRGGLVLLAAWIAALFIMRRARSGAMRLLWTSIFVILFALPLSLQWKSWNIAVVETAVAQKEPLLPQTTDFLVDLPEIDSQELAIPVASSPVVTVPVDLPETHFEEGEENPPPQNAISWWFTLWAIGGIAMGLSIFIGHGMLRALYRKGRPANKVWETDCIRVAKSLGLKKVPPILIVPKVHVPTTAGVFRQRLLLPPAALDFSDAHREAALLHELTHMRGRDPLFILLAHLVLAVHWCNPLAWFGFRALRLAQERRCDDEALVSQKAPDDYADLLVGIARTGRNHFPASVGLALSMAQKSSLSRRVHLILDKTMKRTALNKFQKTILTGLTLGVALPLALTGIGSVQVMAETESTTKSIVDRKEKLRSIKKIFNETKVKSIELENATLIESVTYLNNLVLQEGGQSVNILMLPSVQKSGDKSLKKLRILIEKKQVNADKLRKNLFELKANDDIIDDGSSLISAAAKAHIETIRLESQIKILLELPRDEIVIKLAREEEGLIKKVYEKLLESKDKDTQRSDIQKRYNQQLDKFIHEYRESLRMSLKNQRELYRTLKDSILEKRRQDLRSKNLESELLSQTAALKKLQDQEANWRSTSPTIGLVSLKLSNISAAAALQYITQVAGADFIIQPEAIVIGTVREIKRLEGDDEPLGGFGTSTGLDDAGGSLFGGDR